VRSTLITLIATLKVVGLALFVYLLWCIFCRGFLTPGDLDILSVNDITITWVITVAMGTCISTLNVL